MTAPDLLPGAIAAALRLRPDVDRLYPARPTLLHPVRGLTGLLTEVADDDAVAVYDDHGTTVIEVNVGIADERSARAAAGDLAAAIRALAPAGRPLRVRVRIVSVG